LKTQVFHNKEQDLKQFKAEIKEILESEIASRYYLRDGMVEASFDNDPQLQAAIEVLRNNGGYKEILAKATE
jgi:carboxyl-terminal processing protease